MIDQALLFMKRRLNDHLKHRSPPVAGHEAEDRIVFAKTEKHESINFELDVITMLLVNVELERTLRAPDPFARPRVDGTTQRVYPDIRLNLYVLLVAPFTEYAHGLGLLSRVIRYFQINPVFDRNSAPEMGEGLERLAIELVALPIPQQNELWGSLRAAYRPSLLYKVGLVIYRDEEPAAVGTVIELDVRTTT
jgi:hypothetical protein